MMHHRAAEVQTGPVPSLRTLFRNFSDLALACDGQHDAAVLGEVRGVDPVDPRAAPTGGVHLRAAPRLGDAVAIEDQVQALQSNRCGLRWPHIRACFGSWRRQLACQNDRGAGSGLAQAREASLRKTQLALTPCMAGGAAVTALVSANGVDIGAAHPGILRPAQLPHERGVHALPGHRVALHGPRRQRAGRRSRLDGLAVRHEVRDAVEAVVQDLSGWNQNRFQAWRAAS